MKKSTRIYSLLIVLMGVASLALVTFLTYHDIHDCPEYRMIQGGSQYSFNMIWIQISIGIGSICTIGLGVAIRIIAIVRQRVSHQLREEKNYE